MFFRNLIATVMLASLFIACSGGGDSNSSNSKSRSYQVKLLDDYLDNAQLKDSNNQIAKYRGKGVYEFSNKPQGLITLSGGVFENSKVKNQMSMTVDANQTTISPIASFLYKYPNLKDKIFSALGSRDIDYIKTKDLALFRTSKIVYIMASNDLLDDFSKSLDEVKDYNSIVRTAREVAKRSPRAVSIDSYLAIITLSFFDISNSSYISGINDDVSLSISAIYPENNSTDISVNSVINVTFNKNIQSSSVEGNIILRDSSNKIVQTTINVNDNAISLKPNSDLQSNMTYTLEINNSISSVDKMSLSNSRTTTFTTETISTPDTTKPVYSVSNIANGATNVPVDTKIDIKFTKAINTATIKDNIVLSAAGVNQDYTFTTLSNNTIVRMTPTNTLSHNTTYTLEVLANVEDTSGNKVSNPSSINFTTVDVDLSISSIYPENNSTDISVNSVINVTFNKNIQSSSVAGNIILRDSSNKIVQTTINVNDNAISLKPNSDLQSNMTYTLEINNSISSVDNMSLSDSIKTAFTTETISTPDTTKPVYSVSNIANGATNVPVDTKIDINFGEAINTATIKNNVLLSAAGVNQDYTFTTLSNNAIVRMTPTNTLSHNTTYTLEVLANVEDTSGNKVSNPSSISFTTIASAPVVSDTTIYVTQDGAGVKNGGSWENAYDSTQLQEAINSAATTNRSVWVGKGTYRPTTNTAQADKYFELKSGVKIYGGFNGNETSITQRYEDLSILSGDIEGNDNTSGVVNGTNSSVIVSANGISDSSTLLDGFLIRDANSTSDVTSAMTLINSNITLKRVSFYYNHGVNGGAIHNISSTLNLTQGGFTGNVATNSGGAIHNTSSTINLSDIYFTGNSAINDGGVIYNYNSSNTSITNSSFNINHSNQSGGTVYNDSSSLRLQNISSVNNSAISGGGAIYNIGTTARLTILNSNFSTDHATDSAGGTIYARGGSSATITNTTIASGRASAGGAIYVTNAKVVVVNATFTHNTASEGAAIYGGNGVYFVNSIAWGNGSSSGIVGISSENISNSVLQGHTADNYGNVGTDPEFSSSAQMVNGVNHNYYRVSNTSLPAGLNVGVHTINTPSIEVPNVDEFGNTRPANSVTRGAIQ